MGGTHIEALKGRGRLTLGIHACRGRACLGLEWRGVRFERREALVVFLGVKLRSAGDTLPARVCMEDFWLTRESDWLSCLYGVVFTYGRASPSRSASSACEYVPKLHSPYQ